MKRIHLVGTADTKGEELAFLAGLHASARRGDVCIVDVGTRAPAISVDVPAADVAAFHPEGADAVLGTHDRGQAVAAMGLAFARFITGRARHRRRHRAWRRRRHLDHHRRACANFPSACPRSWSPRSPRATRAPYVDISDIVLMPAVTDLRG